MRDRDRDRKGEKELHLGQVQKCIFSLLGDN
jgi:hypothetical protein